MTRGTFKPLIWLALCVLAFPVSLPAIELTGANGVSVDFAGIQSASPKGLIVKLQADGAPALVAWSKFDLARMEKEHPEIHQAYKTSLGGETTELNLGVFAPEPAMPAKKEDDGAKAIIQGVFETTISGGPNDSFKSAKFGLRLPPGTPRALFILVYDNWDTTDFFARENVHGPWAPLMSQFGLAMVGTSFNAYRGAGEKDAILAYPEEGFGPALIKAIDQLSAAAKKPELRDLPILMYGRDLQGAGFVYNFVQAHPERVVAAVGFKGAYYRAEPTAESAKVPFMFIHGEYDNTAEIAGAIDTAPETYGKHLNLQPNWMYALEYQGPSGDTLEGFRIAEAFLSFAAAEWITPEGPVDVVRNKGWLGSLETKEVKDMPEEPGILQASETWIPSATLATMWKGFLTGTMEVKTPEQGN